MLYISISGGRNAFYLIRNTILQTGKTEVTNDI